MKFILTKIREKLRKKKHFCYIFIHLQISESRVRKCKSSKITLQISFLSLICVCARDMYVSNTKTLRKTLKFILSKCKLFRYIFMHFSEKIERRVWKCKYSMITLKTFCALSDSYNNSR